MDEELQKKKQQQEEQDEIVEETTIEENDQTTTSEEVKEADEAGEEIVEDKQDDTSDERTDDEQPADEEEGTEKTETDSDKTEHNEEGEPTDKTEEVVEEQTKEEEIKPQQEENIEELKRRLEEYETAKQDEQELASIQKLTSDVVADVQKFESIIQKGLMDGLKQFGIDPETTFEELQATDPAKFEIAKQLVEEGNRRIEEHRNKARAILDEQGSNLVFKRAERVINKYNLTKEQAVAAAETFVNIYINTGVLDLDTDLDAKVKLAVAQAKMDIPDVVVDKTDKSDTTVSKTTSVQNEPEVKEEIEKAPDVTPQEDIDMDEYKEGATDSKAKDTSMPNKDAVTADNVLQKLAALPYRERVAFMLEHQAEYEEAMNRRI